MGYTRVSRHYAYSSRLYAQCALVALEPLVCANFQCRMVDTLTQPHRSWNMSRIRGKDTAPELEVRSLLHGAGYRYRLHARDLPGRPDIVVRTRKLAIFVHGCFWHQHPGCANARMPKSRTDFWQAKLSGNTERDKRNLSALRRAGWRVMIIWECQLRRPSRVAARLQRFMSAAH